MKRKEDLRLSLNSAVSDAVVAESEYSGGKGVSHG